jgi:TPR repeat protein
MTNLIPVISTSRNVAITDKKTSSLIGRGLSAILNKETGFTLFEQDARYRQARDIYNRITDYGMEDRFNADLLPKQSKPNDWFEADPLLPFFALLRQLTDAFTVFQQLADQDYGKAYLPLAQMYLGGQGISQNKDKAKYYFRLAFNWCFTNQILNDSEIWTDLGWLYEYPRGVEQYDEQAAYWYSKAAKQGNPNAQNLLGLMWKNGNCKEGENFDEAYFWYRKAAEQGHAEAQTNLGLMWEYGDGVEQDNDEAVYWYGKAAGQGYAIAQYHLGRMYESGECLSILQDNEEAVLLYREAAKQGYTRAQFELGCMCEYGILTGIGPDYKQAMFWYRKAAEQGLTDAKEYLTNLGINWKNK